MPDEKKKTAEPEVPAHIKEPKGGVGGEVLTEERTEDAGGFGGEVLTDAPDEKKK